MHQDIDTDLQQIGLMLDLAADLRYMTPDQKDALKNRISELGKMNGGWMKTAV